MKKFVKENKNFIITISILLGGQAFMYWFLKIFQSNPIYINYFLDNKIPFIGNFVYIYNSFYPFVLVSFYFLYKNNLQNYYRGIMAGVIGFLICDIIFLSFPTIMYRPVIPNINPVTDFILKITYIYDEPPLNCFPSIHCLFCFQVIYTTLKSKFTNKIKAFLCTYSFLIIASTLFIKQHYIYDVISALLVCLIANLIIELISIKKQSIN